MEIQSVNPGSFRDPSGFVFRSDGDLYRQISRSYFPHYKKLMESGLYDSLTEKKWLVDHQVIESNEDTMVIKPRELSLITYPYEWCFEQLKQAAILTLNITLEALEHDMVLKDASAYNIQFEGCRPVFIDTLSFETYQSGEPWAAYGQFCRHFLAPILLMSKKDLHLSKLMMTFIDGIPLELASGLLPKKTWLSFNTMVHLHLHARTVQKYSNSTESGKKAKVSKDAILYILRSLKKLIAKTELSGQKTEWENYYSDNSYEDKELKDKAEVISKWAESLKPKRMIDLGANTGLFSELFEPHSEQVVAADIDPLAVNQNYKKNFAQKNTKILPLCTDLSNPSPSIGWFNQEREAFITRTKFDVVMGLALIHHLVVTYQVPLNDVAALFHQMGETIIVEFVPEEDPQYRKIIKNKTSSHPYGKEAFEKAFERFFKIKESVVLEPSGRTLYLMRALS